MTPPFALAHLDESCLGNGREGENPGGAAGLVEEVTPDGLVRRDVFLHAPATTNNRMALSSAIAVLQLLHQAAPGRRPVVVVSDSEYLVKGMREWVPGWIARGWRRQAGPIENLPLWQALVRIAGEHDVQWTWVRGHQGHAKNEYANDLAIRSASTGVTSQGLEPSGFAAWLDGQRRRGRYAAYDPDADARAWAARVGRGERIPLRDA